MLQKISLTLGLFFSLFFTNNLHAIKADDGSIILSASSEVFYSPTDVQIDFVIASFASSPDASYEIYKKRSDELLPILKAIPAIDEVYTNHFDLSPKYDYKERTKILQGYNTNGFFTLKSDIESIGTLIDLLAKNNVDSIANIEFYINQEELEAKKSEAAKLALKQAISKAEILMADLEITNYKLKNINISDSVSSAPNFTQNGSLLSKSNKSAILAGKQTISTTVAVEIEFK